MLKKVFIFFIGILSVIAMLNLVSPYTAPSFDDINFSLCTGYTAPSFDSINFTLGDDESCDSCSYSSGTWEVDCADACNITEDVDLGGEDITIIGTGTFTTIANISGYGTLHIEGTDSSNICKVTCLSGGCFKD